MSSYICSFLFMRKSFFFSSNRGRAWPASQEVKDALLVGTRWQWKRLRTKPCELFINSCWELLASKSSNWNLNSQLRPLTQKVDKSFDARLGLRVNYLPRNPALLYDCQTNPLGLPHSLHSRTTVWSEDKRKKNFFIFYCSEKYEKSLSVLSYFHVFLRSQHCSRTKRRTRRKMCTNKLNTIQYLISFETTWNLCLFFIIFASLFFVRSAWMPQQEKRSDECKRKNDKRKILHDMFCLCMKNFFLFPFISSSSFSLSRHISSIIIKLYFPAIIAIHFSCLQLLLVFLSARIFCFCFYDNFWQFMLEKEKNNRKFISWSEQKKEKKQKSFLSFCSCC